jgi:hypothetical protein
MSVLEAIGNTPLVQLPAGTLRSGRAAVLFSTEASFSIRRMAGAPAFGQDDGELKERA